MIPLNYVRPSPADQHAASRSFMETMITRRTVRDFSSEPVPFELIANAIRVAASAPSGANQQPWTFVVISDPAVKERIRQAAEAEERESYERRMSDEWLEAIAHLGTDWHKPHLTDAPYLIIVFKQAYGLKEDLETGEQVKVKHYYADESVGIATGMLLAALHISGLVTLTHTPSPMAFLRTICDRPENERPVVLIPVGYPARDAQVPDISRKPLDEVLVHIG
ncbi:MAG: nitroreductase family protein [Chloroflexi bacterium]|nr:nitroreductase family protein [Chloroflexota bacterium]